MAFPRQYLDLRDRQATQEELDQLAPKFQRKCYKAGLTDSWQDCKCIDFPHQSSARPSTCPASCKTCSDQFVPSTSRKNSVVYKVEYHDDRQASSTIDELIRVANTDLAYIRAQIESNGDAIVKTWQGMQQADRVAILRIAMPDLFTNRHADLEVIFEEQRYLTEVLAGRALASEGPTHPENSFFVPFLNKQFLSEDPTRLLALMHHRSHAHLSEWIPSDRERIQKYFHTPVLKNAYNPHCVILRQEKFGRLAQWSRDAAHRWEMCGYPLARQLLRMQCKIADFLKNVVKAILRSSNELPEGRSMWDQVISTSLRSDDDHVTKSAYHSQILAPPPKFDLEQIMSALETQANAALDHAALAQADPIYLRRSLRQIEHSAEYSISTPAEKRRMLFVASVKGMIDCDKWNFLLGRARTLQKSAKKQETIGAQPFQLSREYEDNLLAFESSLIMHFQTLVDELANLVGSNKSFRRYWRKGVQTLQGETAYRQDPLFFALAELGNQSGRNDRPPSWCFSFIDEHLAKASPEERARVDQPLYDHLSDMVVVDEALSGIRAHKSYGPLPPNSPVAEAIYEQIHGKSLSRLIEHLLASCAQDGQIQDTLQSFYKLPLPKKRSNVEMLKYNKTSKQAFTKYWDRVSAKMLSDPVFEDLCSDQKQWVVEKLESYKDGDAYMFETQQSSLANAIRVEGMYMGFAERQGSVD